MTLRAGAALVAFSCFFGFTLSACKSEEQKPQGPTQEEQAAKLFDYPEEPQVEDLPDGTKWPEKLNGAKAVLLCIGGDRIGISEAERAAFEASFNDTFFTAKCPLQNMDAGQAQRAADRRANLSSTASSDALAAAAAKFNSDYVIRCVLSLQLKPMQHPNPQVSGKLLCSADCKIVSRTGEAISSQATQAPIEQITSSAKKSEHREHHAGVLGRVLAKRALLSLTKVTGELAKNEITVIFRGFPRANHEELNQAAKAVDGLEENAVTTKNVTGKDEFGVLVKTKMNIEKYRDALATKITEILSIQAEVARDPVQTGTIIVRKPN